MVNKIAVIVATLILTSCICFKKPEPIEVIKTVEVNIPVYVCPQELKDTDTPIRPVLNIATLTPEDRDSYDNIAKAYKITIRQLQQYAVQLELFAGLHVAACVSAPSTIGNVK